MTYTAALSHADAAVLEAGHGAHYEFLNNLATVKVRAGSGGSMSVVEFLAPQGFGPPLHRHVTEDELFIVLDGELVFHVGDDRIPGGAGAVAHLPRALPHTFQVVSETARLINVTASVDTVPRFDAMVAALGVPTDTYAMPAPMQIDPGRVAEVCLEHDIEIVGPPPPPLTVT